MRLLSPYCVSRATQGARVAAELTLQHGAVDATPTHAPLAALDMDSGVQPYAAAAYEHPAEQEARCGACGRAICPHCARCPHSCVVAPDEDTAAHPEPEATL